MKVEVTQKALAILASWTCIHPAIRSGFLAQKLLWKFMGVDRELIRSLLQGIDPTNEIFIVFARAHTVGQFVRREYMLWSNVNKFALANPFIRLFCGENRIDRPVA